MRRDRGVALVALALVVLLAWLYLARLGGAGMQEMPAMHGMDMPSPPWTARDAVLAFAMWAVMMPAMMLPSAAPMILMFIPIARRRAAGLAHLALFVSGYLVVWTAFSAVATLAQWGLHAAALLSGPGMSLAAPAAGVVLVLAGVYQLTPLKRACLTRCQSPLGFLLGVWRDGPGGSFEMGARHGAFCVGCCWALMAVLFAVGAMNLVWVAAIAAFVLLEKALPLPRAASWASGLALIAWGSVVLLRGVSP